MKIQNSKSISAFGRLNFVLQYLKDIGFNSLVEKNLPKLKSQSKYSWGDIINSLLAIYLCGGDCIEDLHTHLKSHFLNNPFLRIPSPDTVLRRLSDLTEAPNLCKTKRGSVVHTYSNNAVLEHFNIEILKSIGVFDNNDIILDYDNTIIFNEKSDSKMTYKRNPGYQPGVCTVNEESVLFIENRNGNSDAKSFQADTLKRMFDLLKNNTIKKPLHFRADAASYQYDVINTVEESVKYFYIGCRNSYVEKYFSKVKEWKKTSTTEDEIEVGEVLITPFQKQAKDQDKIPKTYRLIVKRKLNSDGQINLFTGDPYDYRAIITNNMALTPQEIAVFYNHRGNMEKQFDILKNDFGWNNMPFSKLSQNTVFLYLTAICRNLYKKIITHFASKVKSLKITYRVKKFLFRFIILPAKWVKHSRQKQLRVYGSINFST